MNNTLADPALLAGQIAETSDKRLDILRRIADVGSISEAARGAGVSYKAAWQAIETLSNLAGGPLVEKVVGGKRGGGSVLTPMGEDVLKIADELTRSRAEVLSRYRFKQTPGLLNIGLSTLATSMRNHFPMTLTKMKIGSALVRLTLTFDDGQELKASLTMESTQLLGLREGQIVLALSKATAIDIFNAENAGNYPEDNRIEGVVLRCARDDKGGECTLQLASGQTIVGFVKANHGLHIGQPALARIPSDAIVVALNS